MSRIARFYKADLQMQTPVDSRNWRGPERLNQGSSPDERRDVARAYIRRCYETGLEIIAITEHNLSPESCDSLIPELSEAAKTLAAEFGYEIVIFPGFEMAVTVGGGVHVLCVFEPGTPVDVLSDKLAMFGLPKATRFASSVPIATPPSANVNLDKLVAVVQEDPTVPGLVIMAHASGNSGVLDNKTIVKWWAESVVADERILCLELPHSREFYLGGQESLMKSILLNSDTRYQRVHPIASIMSSDCKALTKDDDEHNHIGFRHTWLKMGEATIDGLRQAFLDHESRVRFGDSKPEDTYTFPRLSSLAIDGGSFLADQTLHFSPNLNVIIGGSGTGKSTIVQYLRMLFDQASTIRGQDVQANFERSLATVSEATRVTASVILDGQQLQITSEGRSSGEVVASGSELDGKDVSGVFPVRFFGQREIYNIAENRAATVALLDDLDQSRLNALGRQISELSLDPPMDLRL